MDHLVYCQTFSFIISLLYDYVNLKSTIAVLFCRYLSFYISVSISTFSEAFCGDVFVILLTILLTIKSPVACAVF